MTTYNPPGGGTWQPERSGAGMRSTFTIPYPRLWKRWASAAIDYLPVLLVATWGPIGEYLATAFLLYNSVYMQGTTGQSYGKEIVGTQLVHFIKSKGRESYHATFVLPGIGRCAWRLVAHVVDVILIWSIFRPGLNAWGKCYADTAAITTVIDKVDPLPFPVLTIDQYRDQRQERAA